MCDLIGEFFMRSIAGAFSATIGIALGGAISYYLFISKHLQNLELYKERVGVFRKVVSLAKEAEKSIADLRHHPNQIARYNRALDSLLEYIDGQDEVFMPRSVHAYHGGLTRAHERLLPVTAEFPRPGLVPAIQHTALNAVESELRQLVESIRREIQPQSEVWKALLRIRGLTPWGGDSPPRSEGEKR